MAYSVEKRAASMIKKLQNKLKPRAGRRISSAEKGRIKAQISRLRVESQKAQAKRAHAEPAKKAAPKARARERVKTTIAASPGVNKMSRKGYGARKLTQAEGREALNKNTKKPTPARKTTTRMSPSRGGTVPLKGIRTRRPRPSSFDRGRSSRPVFNINR